MITHIAIARRFKAGESIDEIASTIQHLEWHYQRRQYIEHAIRSVLKRKS